MTVPEYIGKGALANGIAAITPALPTPIKNGDLLLLAVETANQAITTPTGWTQVTNSPQSTGTAAAAGGVRLGVFYRFHYGNTTGPTVADSGDHQTAIITAYRGVDPANPINISAGSVDAAATTAITIPAVTTTSTNTLIVGHIGLDKDLADVDTITTAYTNANLTSITERHDESVIAGAGGGVAIVTGVKATAGATGTTTATADTSTTHAYVTVALQGMNPLVRTVGQYRNDGSTTLPTGANSTDGVSNNVTLVTEYSAGHRTTANTPKSETEPVATAFDNTANATLKSRIQDMPSADTTSSRRGSTMVYDDVNKRYLSFGGFDGTTRYNDVWEFYTDEPHRAWRKLAPTGTPPTGRNLHGTCIVKANLTSGGALRMYMIIWGGATPTDVNDMLALRIDTPGSEVWSTITQTSAPSIRSYMSGHVVSTPVSGATDQNYIYLYGGWATARENQLVRCTFDVDAPTAVTWTTLKATGAGGNPPQMTGVVMDYKASTSKLYLYGGYNGTTYYNTFWEYDIAGNTWTDTTPSGTAPTASEVMAGGFDATNNRFWFTGGWTTNGTFTTNLNQIGYISNVGGTEAYNIVRANTLHTDNQAFPGHSFAGFCIDNDKRCLILRGMATVDSTERYAHAIDLDDGITTNKPVYGVSEGEYLTPRDAIGGVWHEDSQEWIMLSGFAHMSDEATIARGTHVSDIWAYSHLQNTWRYANKGFKTLPPMEGRIACYDTTLDRVLIFGGLTGVDKNSNEVWSVTRDAFGNYSSVRLNPTGTPPSDRWLGWIAYDAVNNRMLTGGGRDVSTLFNDMYSLSFSGGADGAWTTLSPSGTPPVAVSQPFFINKTSNNRLYVGGGATNVAASAVSAQMLYFDYTTTNGAWTTPTTSGLTARRGMAFGYDVQNDTIFVTHGFDAAAALSSTQWLNLANTAWVTPTITGYIPSARRSCAGMFINGKMFLFGGRPATGQWFNDTVQLNPNYQVPNSTTWTDKSPRVYTPAYHNKTGLTNNTGYHWQAWSTESSDDSVRVSHG